MSTATWLDSSEQEYEAYDDSGEDYGEAGEDYGEESAAQRRRRILAARNRQQEAARARARAAAMARPGTASSQQRTAAAIRTLDLESKVADDSLRSAVATQRRQIARSQWATAAGVIVNVGMQAFQGPDNPWLRGAVSSLPLLFLDPGQRKGTGFDRFVSDPRIIGGAAVAGLTFLGQNRDRFTQRSHQVSVQSPGTLAPGDQDVFLADVRDRFGGRANVPISWSSNKPEVAKIDPVSGEVTAGEPGVARITLMIDNDPHVYRLRVEAPDGQTPGPKRTLAVKEESAEQKKR